jgi:tetratricopeptide (TPR) repeat protein
VSDPEAAAENYRWLAKAYDGLKRPEQAYRAFEQAVERAPAAEENYLALSVFAMDHANPAFAREALGRGLGLLPNSAKLAMQMGLCWAMEGDFGNARAYFDRAAKADPRWSLPLLALGIADLQAGEAQSAGEAFRNARALDPGDYRCYYLHATAIGRSNPDPAHREEMIQELKRAVELDPKQARVHTALGQAQLPSNPRAAEAQFREALRLDPFEPTALYQLSLLAKRAGNTAEAKRLSQAFERARRKSKEEENELVLILRTPNQTP